MVLHGEQMFVEGTPGKAVPLNLKNGDWGRNYPNSFVNSGGKSLMGFARKDLQKLTLSDDVRKWDLS